MRHVVRGSCSRRGRGWARFAPRVVALAVAAVTWFSAVAASAQTTAQLGCAANGLTPVLGVNYGQSVSSTGENIVALQGDPLQLLIGDRGFLSPFLCQPAGPSRPAGIWHQWFASRALAELIFLGGPTGTRWGSQYIVTTGITRFEAGTQSIVSATAPETVLYAPALGGTARRVVLAPNETVEVTTQLQTTSGVEVRRIITYTNGERAYRMRFEIENLGAGSHSDVRFFHGGDTYFGGDDSARSWWDEALNMVYLNNSSFLTSGIMGLQGAPATPADAFFGGRFSTGNSQARAGQLSNTADSNYVDAGYWLQWNRATLAPGDVWVIEAFERWTDPSPVQVIPPSMQLAAPGSTVTLPFVLHNLAGTAQTFELSASAPSGWTASVTSDTTVELGSLARGNVSVQVEVPAGAAIDELSQISLVAYSVTSGGAGSAAATIQVFSPSFDLSTTSIDFGRVAPEASGAQTVSLTNSGSTVVVGQVGVPNGLDAPFSIASDQCSGATLPSGASCDIVVQFAAGTVERVYTDVFNVPVLAPIVTSMNVSVRAEVNAGLTITMSAGEATYDQDRATAAVDPGIRVAGAAQVDGARIAILDGFRSAEDRLTFTSMHGITGSYNTSTGILSLAGVASPAQYEDVLRSVRYGNIAGQPTAGTRRIQYSLGAAGLYFEPNGHFYEFVTAPGISWTDARNAAADRRYFGLQGYLVTVTSAQENTFVSSKLAGQGWMGASDAEVANIWRWKTGPEGLEDGGLGQHFFTQVGTGGTPVLGRYHNWASGEPNNHGTGEQYAHFLANGQWNDYPHQLGNIAGYVVEYGGMPGDPSVEVVGVRNVRVVTCTDGTRNGVETDIDCGGACGPCGNGGTCAVAGDCTSGVCTGAICQAPTCADGVRNGAETDIDCGGTCGPCGNGGTCAVAGDCTSGVCAGAICQAPTCADGVRNGTETDIDCGGTCGPCGNGGTCAAADDCTSGVCTGAICQAPTCADGVRNGAETDIDCGGDCAACDDGAACAAASDCTSGVCTDGTCQAPTCADGVRNGAETDIDCGGDCAACDDGAACAVASDCTSGVCTDGTCMTATCADGVRNGAETDIDCGGDCAACDDGAACAAASDCTSGVCTDGTCMTATCADGVRNGAETDIDCGSGCGACDDGAACAVAADCASEICLDGRCADGISPMGGILAPSDNDAMNQTRITIEGWATPGVTVDLFLDGEWIATVPTDDEGRWTWTFEESLEEGFWMVAATFTDDVGNMTSHVIEVEIDITAPWLEIAGPADASVHSVSPTTVFGAAEPDAEMALYVNEAFAASMVADEEGHWTFDLEALTVGTHAVRVTATDRAGNMGEREHSLSIVSGARITSPAEGALIRVATPRFEGVGEPGDIIALFLNDAFIAEVVVSEAGTWSWSPDAALADGEWTLTVEGAGDATDHRTIVVDTVRTGVEIQEPANGSLLSQRAPTFRGSALPMATIEITINGEVVATVMADENGQWSWTPDELADGTWMLAFTTTDEAGDAVRAEFTIIIDTVAPRLELVTPEMDTQLPADRTLHGLGEPGTSVRITLNDRILGEVMVNEDGTWSATLPRMEDGDYDLRLESEDEAGNRSVVERALRIGARIEDTPGRPVSPVDPMAPVTPVRPTMPDAPAAPGTTLPRPVDTDPTPEGRRMLALGGGGCSSTSTGAGHGTPALGLLLLGMAVMRRRRAHRADAA